MGFAAVGLSLRNHKGVGFAAFDLWVGDPSLPGGGRYLNPDEFAAALSGLVRTAPVLFDGPYDPEAVWAVASGPETFSGSELHIREGVVARPAVERVSNVTGYRAIAKFVSDDYLTRKGGTEYA